MYIPNGLYITDNNEDKIDEHTAKGINAVIIILSNLMNLTSFFNH